jgi:hypothetical protein
MLMKLSIRLFICRCVLLSESTEDSLDIRNFESHVWNSCINEIEIQSEFSTMPLLHWNLIAHWLAQQTKTHMESLLDNVWKLYQKFTHKSHYIVAFLLLSDTLTIHWQLGTKNPELSRFVTAQSWLKSELCFPNMCTGMNMAKDFMIQFEFLKYFWAKAQNRMLRELTNP